MEAGLAIDEVVLLAAAVVVIGVLTAALAGRFRVPGLLVFLAVGMAVADDGLGLVRFDDAELAQSVSVVALVLILFEGGLTTSWRDVRPVAVPAALLATAGVGITAIVVAGAATLLLDVPATTAWLLGAVVASTDAAAVMSLLRDAPVPRRQRALLEAESGVNDPAAVLLTVGILETWAGDATGWGWALFAVQQAVGGLVAALAVGLLGAWAAERVGLSGGGLFAVLASGLAGLAYGTATLLGGSGFLAVFLVGALLGHRLPRHAHALRNVHEGFALAAQLTLFLLLGLLVFPTDLPGVAVEGMVITIALVVVARPLAVALIVPWFRLGRGAVAFLSWAGLRGAVPIVLATFPLTEAYPDAELVFDVVFFVVLVSVAIQGTTIAPLARRLGLAAEPVPARTTLIGLEHVRADVLEVELDPSATVVGRPLAAIPMPPGIRVSVLERGDQTIVPDGSTVLAPGDLLVVVATTTDAAALVDAWVRGEEPGRQATAAAQSRRGTSAQRRSSS